MLLKVGRHIRPQPHLKLIISREEGENRFLEGYRYQFTSLTTASCPGPLALVDGTFESDEELRLAAAIVARYSKGRTDDEVVLAIAVESHGDVRCDPQGVQAQPPYTELWQWDRENGGPKRDFTHLKRD